MPIIGLWFDVGIKRYTTLQIFFLYLKRCGLMQESKDIQRGVLHTLPPEGCGLMQESKDIQPESENISKSPRCGLMQESKDIQRIGTSREVKNVVV